MRTRRVVVATALTALAVLASGCAVPGEAPAAPPPAAPPDGRTSAASPSASDLPPLPDEGARSTTAEFTDWITDPAADRAWLLDPCRPTDYPTDRERTAFRTVSRQGPEAFDARQLGEYPTPEVAAEVLAGFRRALAACHTGQVSDGVRWTWVTRDVPDLGDDGFLAASTVGGPEYAGHGARVAVTRAGSAVFLAYADGESYTAELDGGADLVRAVAQRFLDSL